MPKRVVDDLLNPNRVFYRLVKDYIDGKLTNNTVYFRARVEAVDVIGGQLETFPPNPAGSIRARVYTSGLDANLPSSALTIFYPFHPQGNIPVIQPGEHVFVVFEDENKTNGLWINKIPNYNDLNYSNPDDISLNSSNNNSADTFEGTNTTQSRSVNVLEVYGGLSTNNVNVDAETAISTIEQSSAFDNKRILHIGDSHVKGFYGAELGRFTREKGASFYQADGRVSWGVIRWLNSNRYGMKTLEELVQETQPDILLISLGSNDFPRADFQRQVENLFRTTSVLQKFWVGPPTMVLNAADINERVSRVADLIKNTIGANNFIDSRNITGQFGRTQDGVHFQQDGARTWASQVVLSLEGKVS